MGVNRLEGRWKIEGGDLSGHWVADRKKPIVELAGRWNVTSGSLWGNAGRQTSEP